MEKRSCLIVLRSGGARERKGGNFRRRSTICIISWKFDNVQTFFHFCPKPRALYPLLKHYNQHYKAVFGALWLALYEHFRSIICWTLSPSHDKTGKTYMYAAM